MSMMKIKFYDCLGAIVPTNVVEKNSIEEVREYLTNLFNGYEHKRIYRDWWEDGVCRSDINESIEPETDMNKAVDILIERVGKFGCGLVCRKYSGKEIEAFMDSGECTFEDNSWFYQPIEIVDEDNKTYIELKKKHMVR